MIVTEKALIPAMRLDTTILPPAQQFPTWAATLPSYDVSQPGRAESFAAESAVWLLDTMVLSVTIMPEVVLERSARLIAADDVDYFSVVFNRRGVWRCRLEETEAEIAQGSVCVLDNTQPFSVITTGGEFIIIVVPRPLLDGLRLPFDLHGHVLQHASGMLFADYLVALLTRLPDLQVEQGPLLAHATRDLLVACLAANRSRLPSPVAAHTTAIRRAQRFIDGNLSAPLTVQDVARALGLSRSGLYRVFANVGGVESFIMRRRLTLSHAALSDPFERRTIASIAFAHGFVSSTHFSRLFKKQFGYGPKDLRARSPGQQNRTPAPRYADFARTHRQWTGQPG